MNFLPKEKSVWRRDSEVQDPQSDDLVVSGVRLSVLVNTLQLPAALCQADSKTVNDVVPVEMDASRCLKKKKKQLLKRLARKLEILEGQ